MNNLIICCAIFLLSNIVAAMPKVGDDAIFALTETKNGGTGQGTVELQLISLDPQTNQFLERASFNYEGQTQVQEQSVDANKLLSDARVADMLANCAQY